MLAKEIVRFANSRGFLDYSVTNVLNHRSLLAHTFSNQCFCSHYPISPLPHKYLHTLKQWDSRLTHSPLCCFCSLAEWEKGICFTVGFWLLFPLEGFFPFCLHFSIIFLTECYLHFSWNCLFNLLHCCVLISSSSLHAAQHGLQIFCWRSRLQYCPCLILHHLL